MGRLIAPILLIGKQNTLESKIFLESLLVTDVITIWSLVASSHIICILGHSQYTVDRFINATYRPLGLIATRNTANLALKQYISLSI